MCGKKTGECIETAHSENEEKKADKTINEKLSDCPSNSTSEAFFVFLLKLNQ